VDWGVRGKQGAVLLKENRGLDALSCTPGFLVVAKARLDKNLKPTDHEVRYALAGNLCRCRDYD
jgi:carbon-monoxide dehydrogenase small subunit